MARNDGIDRTFARNQDLPTLDDVAKVQEHIPMWSVESVAAPRNI